MRGTLERSRVPQRSLAAKIGKRANLLLLREDPTQTIQPSSGIVKIILGGRVLEPAGPRGQENPLEEYTLGQFDRRIGGGEGSDR